MLKPRRVGRSGCYISRFFPAMFLDKDKSWRDYVPNTAVQQFLSCVRLPIDADLLTCYKDQIIQVGMSSKILDTSEKMLSVYSALGGGSLDGPISVASYLDALSLHAQYVRQWFVKEGYDPTVYIAAFCFDIIKVDSQYGIVLPQTVQHVRQLKLDGDGNISKELTLDASNNLTSLEAVGNVGDAQWTLRSNFGSTTVRSPMVSCTKQMISFFPVGNGRLQTAGTGGFGVKYNTNFKPRVYFSFGIGLILGSSDMPHPEVRIRPDPPQLPFNGSSPLDHSKTTLDTSALDRLYPGVSESMSLDSNYISAPVKEIRLTRYGFTNKYYDAATSPGLNYNWYDFDDRNFGPASNRDQWKQYEDIDMLPNGDVIIKYRD